MTSPLRVLYVDDDFDNRALWENGFPKYKVETADSAASALACLARTRPEVLITDHRMPGMSGLELLERVRDIDSSIRRLLVSAWDDEELHQHADGCVQGFFVKPWDRLAIEAAIEFVDVDARVEAACLEAKKTIKTLEQTREEYARFRLGVTV